MKTKLALLFTSLVVSFPVLAGPGGPVVDAADVPEPSTIGLFVAAAIAITLLAKFKK